MKEKEGESERGQARSAYAGGGVVNGRRPVGLGKGRMMGWRNGRRVGPRPALSLLWCGCCLGFPPRTGPWAVQSRSRGAVGVDPAALLLAHCGKQGC